jgi:hypothetical protein
MSTDPAGLPESVAALLDRTLGPGGEPGVLADWLDENSVNGFWDGFAATLRASAPRASVPSGGPAHFNEFRYQIVCPGVMFWVSEGTPPPVNRKRQPPVLLLGVYRTAPFELAVWRRFVVLDDVPKSVRRRLWAAFGISNWADND